MKHRQLLGRAGALVCACALTLSLAPAAGAAEGAPARSDNIYKNDYSARNSTVTSHLYQNGSGLTRVEYIDGQVVIEDYNSAFQLQSSRTIAPELPIWGGFFAGEDYNFIISGQTNPSESDSVEVIRVVKYDKNWNRLGSASLYGANTTVPFDAGSLRCDEYGGYLYIRTCHEMYTTDDGLNHQANLTMAVRQSDMTVTDSYYDIMNISCGYVSHSFNQFILVDEQGNIIAMDHGDAYPRSAVLIGYYSNASTGKFTGGAYGDWCWNLDLQTFAGNTGDNITGAALGGLGETRDGYVMAYNYDGTGGWGDRYIYYHYMDKASGRSWQYQLTETPGGTTPVLAPTGLDGGYVLWNSKSGTTISDTLSYITYDAAGTPSYPIQTAQAPLSDCQPIPYNGGVVWYVTDDSAPTFYVLDASGVKAYPTGEGQETPEPQPEPTPEPEPEPEPEPAGQITFDTLAQGNSTVTMGAAVLADGTLVGWSNALEDWFQGMTTLGTGFVAVTSSGACDYYALKADGTLWAWGNGKFANYTSTLTQIASNVKQISGNLVLKNDGSVWSNLPVDGMTQQQNGVLYKVTDNVRQVWGGGVSLAITNDNTLYSWCSYYSDDLKLGRVPQGEHPNLPAKVMDQVADISGGQILRTDGTLWTWGDELFGQLGNGEAGASQYGLPSKILDNVTRIWGDGSTDGENFAMTADGTLYSWGYNGWSSLGYEGGNQAYQSGFSDVGPLPYQDVPRPVEMELGDVAEVIPCGTTTLFLKTDGSLWGLGNNSGQELNLGQDVSGSRTPVKLLDGVALPGRQDTGTQPTPQPEPSPEPAPSTFTDVSSGAWYAQYASTAASAGLMNGTGEGRFGPDLILSVAEVVTLTARLYAEDHNESVPAVSGAWYQGAYDYCVKQGLFTSSEVPLSTMNHAATRFFMVDLLDRAVPQEEKQAVNTVADGDIPDLRESDPYGSVVYTWYRAGITEGDESGRFNGTTQITRAETAAILCRLAGLTDRV